MSTAPLQPVRGSPFGGGEILEGPEQIGPKPSLTRLRSGEETIREQARKKFLRQILGFHRRMSLAQHESVKRRPIGPAQRFQCRCGVGSMTVVGAQHHAPVSGGKTARAEFRRRPVFTQGHGSIAFFSSPPVVLFPIVSPSTPPTIYGCPGVV